jgi:hypothetical protein
MSVAASNAATLVGVVARMQRRPAPLFVFAS